MPQRRYKKTEKSRQAILDAALALVQQLGYEKTSVRAICKKAGLSTGAFYHHFSGKDALLGESFVHFDDTLTPEAMRRYDALPPLQAVLTVLVEQTAFSERMGAQVMSEYYRALLQKEGRAATAQDRLYYQTVRRYVDKAAQQGLLPAAQDPAALAERLIKSVRGNLLDWCLHDGSYPVAQKTRQELEDYFALALPTPPGTHGV